MSTVFTAVWVHEVQFHWSQLSVAVTDGVKQVQHKHKTVFS